MTDRSTAPLDSFTLGDLDPQDRIAPHFKLYELTRSDCECYDPSQGPNSGRVHISLKAPGTGHNRKQLLSYIRDGASDRWLYVEGLRGSTT